MLKLYCVFRKKYTFQTGWLALLEGKENVYISNKIISLIAKSEKKPFIDKLYVGSIIAYFIECYFLMRICFVFCRKTFLHIFTTQNKK